MKGLLTVFCTITVCAVILPLLIAGVYYRNDNVQSALELPQESAGELVEIVGVETEITETQPEQEKDDIIYSYDDEGDKMLSPHPQAPSTDTQEMVEVTEEVTEETTEQTEEETKAEIKEQIQSNGKDSLTLRVYLHRTKTYKTLTLSEYVKGVILAEMPTYFPLEAFKAQAVACRTYTLYKLINDASYHSSSHGSTGADLCSNSGHCQAFTTYSDCRDKWGKSTADDVWAKVTRAVEETDGEVLMYEGSPILAVYHACSYKRTESGDNAWGGATKPYLKSVSTPEIGLDIVYATKTISSAKVRSYLKSEDSSVSLGSDPSSWFGKVTYNESGRVATYEIGGVTFKGRKVQSIFSLRDNNYTITYDKDSDSFVFEVRGWGHGVGLSQYGAYIMAKDQGCDYKEILHHYYTNVELQRHNYK